MPATVVVGYRVLDPELISFRVGFYYQMQVSRYLGGFRDIAEFGFSDPYRYAITSLNFQNFQSHDKNLSVSPTHAYNLPFQDF